MTWLITIERGRGDQPWVLGTQMSMLCPVKYRFFIPCCIYTTQIIFLKIFQFFYFPLLNSVTWKKLFLGKKILEGYLSSLATPKLCLWFLVCLIYFNSYYTQLPYQLIWIWLKLSWLKCINVGHPVHKSKEACLTQTSHSDKKTYWPFFLTCQGTFCTLNQAS